MCTCSLDVILEDLPRHCGREVGHVDDSATAGSHDCLVAAHDELMAAKICELEPVTNWMMVGARRG